MIDEKKLRKENAQLKESLDQARAMLAALTASIDKALMNWVKLEVGLSPKEDETLN